MLLTAALLLGLPVLSLAKPILTSRQTTSDACAKASQAEADYYTENNLDPDTNYGHIPADIAYECLTSVPLHMGPAKQLVNSLKGYFQAQSTVDFLRQPPEGWLYPSLDLPRGLDDILEKIENEQFNSEYDFQIALDMLIGKAYDGHFSAAWDLKSVLLFRRNDAEVSLVSVSADGKALPKVYRLVDVVGPADNGFDFALLDTQGSAVSQINGIDVDQFLQIQSYVANFQDPDAQYNEVVFTVGKNLQPNLGGTQFGVPLYYPGPETVLTFENGTTFTSKNYAKVMYSLDGIATGEDMYQRFCTGADPTSTSLNSTEDATGASATQTSSTNATESRFPSYPYPTVMADSGALSGYFLEDADFQDVAVLVIRSFDGDAADFMHDFQNSLETFLAVSEKAGKTKLILDLQGNGGGFIDLGTDLMAQLFPDTPPNTISDMRASTGMNMLMEAAAKNVTAAQNADTSTSDDETEVLEGEYAVPFAYQTVMTPDAKNFDNFHDYYGPYSRNHGTFTNFFQSNYTNDLPSEWDTTRIDITGYGNRTGQRTQVFQGKDIIVLTDGYCASTCTVVSEALKNRHQVQFVAMGGRPQTGPMQAIGGVKGSQIFSAGVLQGLVEWWHDPTLVDISEAAGTPWADFDETPLVRGFQGINGRNHYRAGDSSNTALQFVYEAADCRIWHTADMLTDISVMWNKVATIGFKDRDANGAITSDYCVQDSANHATSISGGLKAGSLGPQTPPANAKPKYSGYLLNGTKVVDTMYNGGGNAGYDTSNVINTAALNSLKNACQNYDGSKWFVKMMCNALG